ncbi:hypothetical protein MMC18_003090 [Xylographa bjoerkii]|nr:hypothetical protein [Xylographa bjoerkii]
MSEPPASSTATPAITHATKSHPRREIAPIRNGSRFLPHAIWHLVVGPFEVVYDMHEHVLHQSPVLAAMCAGNFLERAIHAIHHPEDDAEAFGYLAEYLYT